MLDRTIAPEFGTIETINLMEPKVYHLDNGIPVFCIDAGAQEVLKVELVFNAGTATASKKLVASAAIKLLTEGTSKRTGSEIADAVDFYGAYLQVDVSHDECSLDLYTLSKYLKDTLPVMAEVYSDATFPAHEVETYLLKGKQEMLVSQEKVGYLSSKAFNAALFGELNPYGRSADTEDYDNVTRDDLSGFYQDSILGRIKHIIVSGKLGEDTTTHLNDQFGHAERKPLPEIEVATATLENRLLHVQKEKAVQNSIKIGRILFNRSHPDFVGMQILSTVLGGYFGSRLMDNIREDKGYTYGIRAGMVSMKHSGYFTISTEVGSDVCKDAISEIFKEIERLRKEPISIGELELLRNYMLGSILKSVDGPFSIASTWKRFLKYGLGADSHLKLIHEIKNITPERLMILANKYLQREDLVLVTAGSSF